MRMETRPDEKFFKTRVWMATVRVGCGMASIVATAATWRRMAGLEVFDLMLMISFLARGSVNFMIPLFQGCGCWTFWLK